MIFILYCCKQMWGVEKGSIFMVGPGRHYCSWACGGIVPRWFKV